MNNIEWDFGDKNVLVVGSSRGIGKGVVDGFKKSGANVIELDSSICDISNKEEIDLFVDSLYEIDILVNVAGMLIIILFPSVSKSFFLNAIVSPILMPLESKTKYSVFLL